MLRHNSSQHQNQNEQQHTNHQRSNNSKTMSSSNDLNGGAPHRGEQEPLLGAPGDATQKAGSALLNNLWIGTAVLAQAGIWILAAIIWGAVFSHDVILFSAHPLLNSAGVLLSVQSILILQPTATAEQKKKGALAHAALNDIGTLALLAGFGVILKNKIAHNGTHFESPHAILGLIVYILLVLQVVIGITMFFAPQVYGGERKAKSIWKYHRISGYLTHLLILATVASATQTDYNKNVLHIKLWAVLVAAILVLAGVVPRIKKQKLGF